MSQRSTTAAAQIELMAEAQRKPAGVEATSAAPTVHRLGRRALSLGAANAFDYGLQFLLPLVLVRCLDPAEFGQYRLLWLAVGTVMALAPLAMAPSLYYFLPRSDRATKRLYINQTLLFLVAGGLIAAWAVSPWNPWLPLNLQGLSRHEAVVPVFVLLWVVASLLDMLPMIEERVTWQAKATVGLAALRAVALSLVAVLARDLDPVLLALIAFVVIKLGLLFSYVAVYHGLRGPIVRWGVFADQVKYAAPFGASGALYELRWQADQWVAAALFPLGRFASFSIAAILGPLLSLFRQSVNNAFLPSMSRLQAAGDVHGMIALNSRANVMVGSFIYPLFAFAFAFAEDIVTVVYTAAYVDAAPVMRLYTLGFLASVVELATIMLLLRQGGFMMRLNLLVLPVSVALSWYAAHRFGFAGAAVGSVAAIYFDRVATLRRIALHTGIPFRHLQDWRSLGRLILSAAVGALLAWCIIALYRKGDPLRATGGRRRDPDGGLCCHGGAARRRPKLARRRARFEARHLRQGMPRVMFVIGSLAHGGAERHAITIMNRLQERGHDCHAIYIKSGGEQQLNRIRLRDSATVRTLDATRYFDRRSLADLARHIARVRPSVIVATNAYALMYSSLALRASRLRVPLVVTFHSTVLLSAKEWLQMLVYRPFFWMSNCVVFVCEKQRRYWLYRGVVSRRNEVIYNGVDTEEFCDKWNAGQRATMRRTLGFGDADYVIGLSAVLRPEKNHRHLVEAVAILRRRGIPARALMIGDGPTRAAVEAHARQLEVASHIVITGFQQDVRPYIAACDAMTLCSTTEAFSLAAIEAMALGKPVVHSEVGGAAEMIFPGKNGFLFPVGDTEAFVDRLAKLADRTVSTHMGKAARQVVEALFSEKTMVDRYEKVILQTLMRPRMGVKAVDPGYERGVGARRPLDPR